ncbi:protein TIFY 10b-like isoform X1 [Nicotiana sylvestris]|uniref:Protein TIFY n=1 Tax=Nicotiana sylvestris TaxID=4096 RepID=A0A1U7YFX8_NICSY|nr:PREDICTED: protein TIFY 10B-like isoform X1 [Nicotiana sylvestris]
MSSLQLSSDGKSSYMQTCNLLSQYLNGKATLKDIINLGINGDGEIARYTRSGKTDISQVTETATMDFLTNMEEQSTKTMDQLQDIDQNGTTNSFTEMEASINKASNSSKEIQKELKAAQLSIFYGGKVIVFDDFPADKARAMMLLASKGSPHNSCAVFNTTSMDKTGPPNSAANTFGVLCLSTSDLPIARRSALHRFLGRRKDRDTARAPYQVQNLLTTSSKNEEPTSVIRDQSHFDLNFTL